MMTTSQYNSFIRRVRLSHLSDLTGLSIREIKNNCKRLGLPSNNGKVHILDLDKLLTVLVGKIKADGKIKIK